MMESMRYPKDPMEYIRQFAFRDWLERYTNGLELVPLFRVEEMIEHYMAKKAEEDDAQID